MYEDSWFQLEGAAWRPFRHPFDAVRHGFNFMQYKLRQNQVRFDAMKRCENDHAVLKALQLGCTPAVRTLPCWTEQLFIFSLDHRA